MAIWPAQFEILHNVIPGRNEHLDRLKNELARYFAGTLHQFTVPLLYPGTPFQQQVWEELTRIPYGETRTYKELAACLGRPGAQRAVGRANGLWRLMGHFSPRWSWRFSKSLGSLASIGQDSMCGPTRRRPASRRICTGTW